MASSGARRTRAPLSEVTVIWTNKSVWKKPGPIVAMGVLNAWSFAQIGLDSHFFIGDDGSGSDTADDLESFYGLPSRDERLHVHRIPRGGRLSELLLRKVYSESLRFARASLERGGRVLFLTRELGLVPALARLRRRYGNRLAAIHEAHDYFATLDHIESPTLTDRRKRWCERRYLPRIGGLLCITPDQEKLYRQALPDVPTLAFPLGCLDHGSHETKLARRTVAYVGHLHGRKGVQLLVKLAPRLAMHGISLRLYGGHPEQIAQLERKVAKLGASDAVRFLPFMPPTALHRELAASVGAFLCPLKDTFYNRYLTCPVKALDALSHRAPTVASDLPSTRAVLGEAALYVEPENLEALAEATVSLFDDPDRYARLSEAARRRAEALQWPNRARAILEWSEAL